MNGRNSSLLDRLLIPLIIAIVGGAMVLFLEYRTDFFQNHETTPEAITVSVTPQEVTTLLPTPSDTLMTLPTPEVTEGGVGVIETPSDTDIGATATPMALATLDRVYNDEFSDGLDSTMWVISGTYRIVNDQLIAIDPMLMSTGQMAWTDYVVDIDIPWQVGAACPSPNTHTPIIWTNAVIVRFNPDRMLAVDFHTCYSSGIIAAYLWEMKNSEWTEIAPFFYDPTDAHQFSVIVFGNKIGIYVDERELLTYITDIQSGWVGIYLRPGSRITGISISPPD